MSSEPIERIKIGLQLPSFKEIGINDGESIDLIVKYFNGIHPKMTMKNINCYYGGGYFLEFSYNNGRTKTVSLEGNMFMVINKKFASELPYKEAIEFDGVLGNVLLNHYRSNKSKLEIEGRVISISTDENPSGRIQVMTLEKADGSTTNVKVDVDNSYTFDMTGDGSYMRTNCYVNIFVDKADSSDIPLSDVAIITINP